MFAFSNNAGWCVGLRADWMYNVSLYEENMGKCCMYWDIVFVCWIYTIYIRLLALLFVNGGML